MEVIRVGIATQSPLVRAGIETILAGVAGIEIAERNAGPDGREADVILADPEAVGTLTLGGGNAGPGIIVLGDLPAQELLRSGVRAVVPAGATQQQILAAIGAVASGFVLLQPEDLDELLAASPASAPVPTTETLTQREIEVLRLMSEGESNKTIAWRLGISEHTVKFHVASIMAKLEAGSRTEAVTRGLRQGLIIL